MNREIAIIALGIYALHTIGGVSGCLRTDPRYVEKESLMAEKTIEQVQEAHTDEWMAIDGVEGTAIGLFGGKPCIKIFLSIQAGQLKEKIPSIIEGYPVIIVETGTFRAIDRQ
jgi:hypothetical protein